MWCSFPRTSETGEGFETHHKDSSVMYITGHDRGWIFLYEKLPQPTKEQASYTDKDVEAYAARFAEFPVNETLKVKDVFALRLTSGMANLEEGLAENWSWGRIVLVGDACHAFTPNIGLGFNNGIQDVVALCNGLRETLAATSTGQPSIAALTKLFKEYQSMRYETLQGDASRSAAVTRMQAWASTPYFLMARYIMVPRFVEYLFLKFISFSVIRHGLVLDYVSSEEPCQGSVSWIHQMKSPLGA
jgi:2-polyprenyl-6-methoxyphenol hydroxylase-like FAD-dependent oxidoreductase